MSDSKILMLCAMLVVLCLGTTKSMAAEQGGYVTGTLVRAESCQDNCTRIVVQLGDVVYVAVQNANFHWQVYAASEFEENGPVDVRIDGAKLCLKRPNGKELKAKIIRRVRVGANAQSKLESLVGIRPSTEDQRSGGDVRTRGTAW